MSQFNTALGCTISAHRALDVYPHLGNGILLVLHMQQPDDDRRVEVFLNPQDIANLRRLIDTVE